eukprot:333158-Chlamydomonas_euryale.AAC.8
MSTRSSWCGNVAKRLRLRGTTQGQATLKSVFRGGGKAGRSTTTSALHPTRSALHPTRSAFSPHTEYPSPRTECPSPHAQRPSPHTERPSPHTECLSPHTECPSPHTERRSPHMQYLPDHYGAGRWRWAACLLNTGGSSVQVFVFKGPKRRQEAVVTGQPHMQRAPHRVVLVKQQAAASTSTPPSPPPPPTFVKGYRFVGDAGSRPDPRLPLRHADLPVPKLRSKHPNASQIASQGIAASVMQTHGPAQGYLFNMETFQPLAGSAGMAEALSIYARLLRYVSPASFSACNTTNAEFLRGRCAVSIKTGTAVVLASAAKASTKGDLGAQPLPGSTRVSEHSIRLRGGRASGGEIPNPIDEARVSTAAGESMRVSAQGQRMCTNPVLFNMIFPIERGIPPSPCTFGFQGPAPSCAGKRACEKKKHHMTSAEGNTLMEGWGRRASRCWVGKPKPFFVPGGVPDNRVHQPCDDLWTASDNCWVTCQQHACESVWERILWLYWRHAVVQDAASVARLVKRKPECAMSLWHANNKGPCC